MGVLFVLNDFISVEHESDENVCHMDTDSEDQVPHPGRKRKARYKYTKPKISNSFCDSLLEKTSGEAG